MPEKELPTHLQRAEVDAALVCLVKNAGDMAKARKLARTFAYRLPAMDADDLLQKAMTLMLAEKRKWPRGLPTLVMLEGVMRSVAFGTRKKADYLLAEDLGSPTDEDTDSESSLLAEGISRDTDPARRIEGESELDVVANAVKGDEELEFYVEALADGLVGKSIAQELSWSELKYDAVRKRLSRRLASLKTERS